MIKRTRLQAIMIAGQRPGLAHGTVKCCRVSAQLGREATDSPLVALGLGQAPGLLRAVPCRGNSVRSSIALQRGVWRKCQCIGRLAPILPVKY